MTEAGIHLWLRLTARATFVLFLFAFTGNALRDLWPSAVSAWLARQRDWFLLGAAASHTLHLAAILALLQLIGWSRSQIVTLIGGGFVYLLIYGLAIVAVLRMRGRREIFLLGLPRFEAFAMYAIWLIFVLAFVRRIVSGWPVYSVLGVIALAALVLRIACLVLHRHAIRAAA
jgi:hypothetical protein